MTLLNVAKLSRTLLPLVALFLPQHGVSDVQTVTQGLAPNIEPAGKISVPGNITLASANTHFGEFRGTLLVNYWLRTSDGGSGQVVVQANSEFSPAGGPSVESVTFSCSGATLGTSCQGTQAIRTTAQSTVLTLSSASCTGGGGSCSNADPNTVQLDFYLPNRTSYKTGTFTTQLIFTISAI